MYLEHFVLSHVGRQSSERLSTAASHTDEEGVTPWLLQNTTDPTHVLYGKPVHTRVLQHRVTVRVGYGPKEHEVHGFLADVVVFVQEVLCHQPQLVHVHHLGVGLGVVLGVHKVAEHETTQVVLFHHSYNIQ